MTMEGFILKGPIWIAHIWYYTFAHYVGPRVLTMTIQRCVLEGPIWIAPIWYNTFAHCFGTKSIADHQKKG